ncbi:50S ribosomal protein L1 [Candidatus Saccharibacteria bacterium]|nr:MAG: 50S ribosomal protein L1 [Candidatus Saccharibacteria bacterium]
MAEAKKTTTKKKSAEAEEVIAPAAEEVVDAPAETTPEVTEEVAKEEKPKATAKAGKRSEKALKEEAEKVAKEERKAAVKTEEDKPKAPAPKTRSVLERKGKKFQEVAKLVEVDKEYTLAEALALAVKTNPAKFDASVELHIRLGVDPRQADQNIRGSLVLPAGTGKTVRIAVFADTDDAAKAKKAGADIAGIEEVAKALDKGQINFDVLIAVPTQMAKLGKYARLLGPRGLMPNPKSGTVTPNVVKAVEEAKAGRVEFRVDSTGIVHLAIGKVSFDAKKLEENADAVLSSIRAAKPSSIKGNYIKSLFVTTSMGPGIKTSVN